MSAHSFAIVVMLQNNAPAVVPDAPGGRRPAVGRLEPGDGARDRVPGAEGRSHGAGAGGRRRRSVARGRGAGAGPAQVRLFQ